MPKEAVDGNLYIKNLATIPVVIPWPSMFGRWPIIKLIRNKIITNIRQARYRGSISLMRYKLRRIRCATSKEPTVFLTKRRCQE